MQIYPQLIVCMHCDTVCRRQALRRREIARCERCDAVLYRGSRLELDQWLALTITAAIAFIIANVFPLISISLQGIHNDATLWEAMVALAYGSAAPIAVPAVLSVIVIPFMQITGLGWVLAFARIGRRPPGFIGLMKMLTALRPWSMVEVCLLGILVAVVKLSSYLDVIPEVGLWGTAILTILIAIIANSNLHWLWELIDHPLKDNSRL